MLLSQKEIDQVKKNLPTYIQAEYYTGVNRFALAGCHYREHSLDPSNPHRVGGPFQFDPPLTETQMRYLLKRYTNIGKPQLIEEFIKSGINKFDTAAVFAACWLRHKGKYILTPDAPDEYYKDAFWGYNGRSYGSADKSPYVMNNFDKDHMNMVIVGTVPDSHDPSKRIKVRTVDKRPGAFTVFRYLKGLSWT